MNPSSILIPFIFQTYVRRFFSASFCDSMFLAFWISAEHFFVDSDWRLKQTDAPEQPILNDSRSKHKSSQADGNVAEKVRLL